MTLKSTFPSRLPLAATDLPVLQVHGEAFYAASRTNAAPLRLAVTRLRPSARTAPRRSLLVSISLLVPHTQPPDKVFLARNSNFEGYSMS